VMAFEGGENQSFCRQRQRRTGVRTPRERPARASLVNQTPEEESANRMDEAERSQSLSLRHSSLPAEATNGMP
jgi:hypothetical protein